MAGGFNNSVLGGMSKLIRAAIQSPNYVAGLTGWSINKDGSAEFNNVTFRGTVIIETANALLVYSGPPAAGNLVAAISSAGGFDAFGNGFSAGVWIKTATQQLQINDPTAGKTSNTRYTQNVDGSFNMSHNPQVGQTNPTMYYGWGGNSNGLILGISGFAGKTYTEYVDLANETIPNLTLTPLTGLFADTLASDYGTCFNLATGVWTAPVTSAYTFGLSQSYTAWVAGSRMLWGLKRNGVLERIAECNPKSGIFSTTFELICNAGDTVTFNVVQETGATQFIKTNTAESTIQVRRNW